jgi:hypothetical protein
MTRKRSFAVLCAVLASIAATGSTVSGCSGDKCLADGENCSQSYLQANGKTAYVCCNGQTCMAGQNSGVLICRF